VTPQEAPRPLSVFVTRAGRPHFFAVRDAHVVTDGAAMLAAFESSQLALFDVGHGEREGHAFVRLGTADVAHTCVRAWRLGTA
jgi:hypothetical protein